MASSTLIFLLTLITSCSSVSYSASISKTDTLKPGQLLRDWEQLVSARGTFRLGFFTPSKTTLNQLGTAGPRYLGIWFDHIPYYSVWVANRETPVPDSSGALIIGNDGQLKITHQGGSPIVITSSNEQAKNSTFSEGNIALTLLDSGNLVIRHVGPKGSPGPVLWQSFDYPHNMLLPGMKLGMNFNTGQNWSITSWLSDNVPAPGAFRLGLDPTGANQVLVWRRGEVYWSSGVWKSRSFKLNSVFANDIYEYIFVTTKEERYFSYSVKNDSKNILSRIDLDTIGQITLFFFDGRNNQNRWIFETKGPCEENNKNYSAVCLTEKPNICRNKGSGEMFFTPKRGYMDQFYESYSALNLSLSDCHAQCWKNCTCVAYQSYTNDGIGCKFWSKGSKFYPDETAEILYLATDKQ